MVILSTKQYAYVDGDTDEPIVKFIGSSSKNLTHAIFVQAFKSKSDVDGPEFTHEQ